MTPTASADHSQPNDGNVVRIDGWRKPGAAGVDGHRTRIRSGTDIGQRTDSHEPVPGSDEWWNQTLGAFKAYIELCAVAADASAAEEDDDGTATEDADEGRID